MPHKHKRRKENNTASLYDLPPTTKALPLSTAKTTRKSAPATSKPKPKKQIGPTPKGGPVSERKERATELPLSGKVPVDARLGYGKDDTPRAFARLLNYHRTGQGVLNGLDNGEGKKSKKRKREQEDEKRGAGILLAPAPATSASAGAGTSGSAAGGVAKSSIDEQLLRIQPGEKLSDFGIRVDQMLPLSGISTKGKKVEGIKEKRTKHDKRLKKLQDGWRAEDVKIREKEEEEREIAEEEWEEKLAGMDKEARAIMLAVEKQQQGKKKKAKQIGEVDDDEDDPWAVLEKKREKPKGVFEVNVAPPTFKKLPRELFKESKARDVPKEAGSLRRREELGETRAEIIGRYRAMMARKRAVEA